MAVHYHPLEIKGINPIPFLAPGYHFFFFLTSHLYPDKQIVAKGCNLPWSGLRKEAMGVPVTRPAEWLREPYTPQAGGQEAP